MKPISTILTAIGTLLLAAACQTEQLPTDGSPFAPGEERPLIITPVVSSAIATRATTDPVTVTLVGGNLALTLSKNGAAGAPTQTAVYAAVAPFAYDHQATADTLVKRGLNPNEARALSVTNAGNYPLAAVGTALRATTTRTEQIVPHPSLGVGTNPVAATARLPFALHVRRTAVDAPIAVAADGTATLPLNIASAGVMLRMKYKAGETSIVINSVRCLPTGETAPHERDNKTDAQAATASRVVTATTPYSNGTPDNAIDADAIGTDHVLFGTLAPEQTLAAGSTLVEINATLVTSTGNGNTSEDKLFTVALPRAVTPQAGQLLTYTVHVNHSVATIVGEVEISDFIPANGNDGEDIGIGSIVYASGMEPLDPNVFNAQNPVWVVTGGGTPEADAIVLKNVRDALNRIYAPVDAAGNWNSDYTGAVRIDLQLPEVTTLPKYTLGGTESFGTFAGFGQLRSINAPQVSIIEGYALNYCLALQAVSMLQATSIGENAFRNCAKLTTISLPKASSIEGYAFDLCTALQTINLPKATTTGDGIFNGCEKLATVSLPRATSLGERAFQACRVLQTINLPEVKTVGQYAFGGCLGLTAVRLPKATSIGNNVFTNCRALKTLSVPMLTNIGKRAISSCIALTYLELPAAGNFTLDAEAFFGYDPAICDLVLHSDKADGGTATPTVQETVSGNKDWRKWGGRDNWKSITHITPAR